MYIYMCVCVIYIIIYIYIQYIFIHSGNTSHHIHLIISCTHFLTHLRTPKAHKKPPRASAWRTSWRSCCHSSGRRPSGNSRLISASSSLLWVRIATILAHRLRRKPSYPNFFTTLEVKNCMKLWRSVSHPQHGCFLPRREFLHEI